jgi:hypothetical protein
MILASFASHNFAAFSATTSRTGWISLVELAMTRKISLVAACRSADCLSSRACAAIVFFSSETVSGENEREVFDLD